MANEYNKGYRSGVMAERRRAILVALRAVNLSGNPSLEGYSLAHQIGRAGDQIPGPLPKDPERWSIYGERRLVKDTPTYLERSTNPFTKSGLKYIENLEKKYSSGRPQKDGEFLKAQDAKRNIAYLEDQMADATTRIKELEGLVDTLSLQLTGVID